MSERVCGHGGIIYLDDQGPYSTGYYLHIVTYDICDMPEPKKPGPFDHIAVVGEGTINNPFNASIRHSAGDICHELGRKNEILVKGLCAECDKDQLRFPNDYLCVWCRYTTDTGLPMTPWGTYKPFGCTKTQ